MATRKTSFVHDAPFIEARHQVFDRWAIFLDGVEVGPRCSRNQATAIAAWLEDGGWDGLAKLILAHAEMADSR